MNNQPAKQQDLPPPSASGSAATIAAQLRRAIVEGVYSYRERLPAERELAGHFGASRSTVREALRQLEETNMVVRRIGSGTFVNYRTLPGENNIAELTSPLELIEVRLAVEPHMVRLAVTNATQRDLERLGEALESLEACGNDREAYSRYDAQFHLALAECTRNPLMVWLYRHVNDVRNHAQWSAMKDLILTGDRVEDYNEQHRGIFEAIKTRDADRAVRIITAHLATARRHLLGASHD